MSLRRPLRSTTRAPGRSSSAATRLESALISPILYAFHHVGKPPIELLLSAPTDVLFGLVDYESNSILPSIVAHGFGLALLDWLVLHPPIVPTATVVRVLSWLPIPL